MGTLFLCDEEGVDRRRCLAKRRRAACQGGVAAALLQVEPQLTSVAYRGQTLRNASSSGRFCLQIILQAGGLLLTRR